MYDQFADRGVTVVAVAQEDQDLESHGKILKHFEPAPCPILPILLPHSAAPFFQVGTHLGFKIMEGVAQTGLILLTGL